MLGAFGEQGGIVGGVVVKEEDTSADAEAGLNTSSGPVPHDSGV